MKNRLVCSFVVLALLAFAVAGQKLEPPKLEPTPDTESQRALIKEGVGLHDKGDYDGAINRYEQVLTENPNSISALYEMSFSYFAKKDYQKSIDVSFKAAEYKSNLLPAIYLQIGNCFDELGNSKQALDVYKAGIKLNPSSGLLYYNLAITLARTGQFEDSRVAAKKAAALDPNHRSSQLMLSNLFAKAGYQIPALLAACRFLILEPNSSRSEAALGTMQKIMVSGVSRTNEKEINIFVATQPKKDEGDFEPIDLFLKLAMASNYTEENKNKTKIELLAGNFETLFGFLSEGTTKDQSKFTWKYYVPYFADLKRNGHTEAFVYYINQRGVIAGVDQWLQQNQTKVADFLTWSRAYRWPKID